MPHLKGEFKVTDMREETYATRPAGKLTRAGGSQTFSGAIEGTGEVEWLMAYHDGSADFVGLQQIDGALDGKRGTVVLTSVGSYHDETSTGEWTVVEGSGTDELEGISGTGSWKAARGPNGTFELDYELS